MGLPPNLSLPPASTKVFCACRGLDKNLCSFKHYTHHTCALWAHPEISQSSWHYPERTLGNRVSGSVPAHVQWRLEEKSHAGHTWMGQCRELSLYVLCALPKQEQTMEFCAPSFCQVLSSEDFIFLMLFLEESWVWLKAAGLFIKNTMHTTIHLKLDFHSSNPEWPHEMKHLCRQGAEAWRTLATCFSFSVMQ